MVAAKQALTKDYKVLREQASNLLESQDGTYQHTNSLATELANCQARLQEAMVGQTKAQLEMAQLKNKVTMETERRLHTIEERDRNLSQVLERGNLLACLRTETLRTTTHLMEFNSILVVVSRDVIKLTTQLQSHETSQADNIQVLAEGLRAASQEYAVAMATLIECQASEEDKWKARERQLIDRLGPKATSFFQMGFEGAVKQFAARGYPPHPKRTPTSFTARLPYLNTDPRPLTYDLCNFLYFQSLCNIFPFNEKYQFAVVCLHFKTNLLN